MTELHEGDRVRILHKDLTGEIIDVTTGKDGNTYYQVESDQKGPVHDPDASPGLWPVYTCSADQLMKI